MGETDEHLRARRLFNRLHFIILNWVNQCGLIQDYCQIDPDELETVSKLFERLQEMKIEDKVMVDKMQELQLCLASITRSNGF